MFYILLQDFLGDLKTQRTRAFLTFFAVTWGTLAVVLLLAFGEGLKRPVRAGLLGAGERMFMVYGAEQAATHGALQALPERQQQHDRERPPGHRKEGEEGSRPLRLQVAEEILEQDIEHG